MSFETKVGMNPTSSSYSIDVNNAAGMETKTGTQVHHLFTEINKKQSITGEVQLYCRICPDEEQKGLFLIDEGRKCLFLNTSRKHEPEAASARHRRPKSPRRQRSPSPRRQLHAYPRSLSPRRAVHSPRRGRVAFNVDVSTPTAQRGRMKYKFSHILDETASQQETYEATAKPFVQRCIEGYNSTILCYGPTSTGKTWTMLGPAVSSRKFGIVPRFLKDLFAVVPGSASVSVSFVSIYQEKVFDLLDRPEMPRTPRRRQPLKLESLQRVQVLEDNGRTVMKNLNTEKVVSTKSAIKVFTRGMNTRCKCEESTPDMSSRAHSVFTVNVSIKEGLIVRSSKVNFVVLAGSENVRRTRCGDEVLIEAQPFNYSLHCLQESIAALQHKSTQRMKAATLYHKSTLTAILQGSIGGNCLTAMIATMRLTPEHLVETIRTCRFAQRVATIKNKVKPNETITLEDPVGASLGPKFLSLRDGLSHVREFAMNGDEKYNDVSDTSSVTTDGSEVPLMAVSKRRRGSRPRSPRKSPQKHLRRVARSKSPRKKPGSRGRGSPRRLRSLSPRKTPRRNQSPHRSTRSPRSRSQTPRRGLSRPGAPKTPRRASRSPSKRRRNKKKTKKRRLKRILSDAEVEREEAFERLRNQERAIRMMEQERSDRVSEREASDHQEHMINLEEQRIRIALVMRMADEELLSRLKDTRYTNAELAKLRVELRDARVRRIEDYERKVVALSPEDEMRLEDNSIDALLEQLVPVNGGGLSLNTDPRALAVLRKMQGMDNSEFESQLFDVDSFISSVVDELPPETARQLRQLQADYTAALEAGDHRAARRVKLAMSEVAQLARLTAESDEAPLLDEDLFRYNRVEAQRPRGMITPQDERGLFGFLHTNEFRKQRFQICLWFFWLLVLTQHFYELREETWHGLYWMDLFLKASSFLSLTLFCLSVRTWTPCELKQTSSDQGREFRDVVPDSRDSVDIIITTYKEPLNVVLSTVLGAIKISYPSRLLHVYVLDDGVRDELKRELSAIQAEHPAVPISYITRTEHVHAKAGNVNNGLRYTRGKFFVMLDCDMIPKPDLLNIMMEYYYSFPTRYRSRIAFIQTPQIFGNFNHSTDYFNFREQLFYKWLVKAASAIGTCPYVGTGAMFRKKALEEIGGFHVGHATEDTITGCILHQAGWRSHFLDRYIAEGICPNSLPDVIDQRIRWVQGGVQMFFDEKPFFKSTLNADQRLFYFQLSSYWFFGILMMFHLVRVFVHMGIYLFGSTEEKDELMNAADNSATRYSYVSYWLFVMWMPELRWWEGVRCIQMFLCFVPVYLVCVLKQIGCKIKVQTTVATNSDDPPRWHPLMTFHVLSISLLLLGLTLLVARDPLDEANLQTFITLLIFLYLFFPVFRSVLNRVDVVAATDLLEEMRRRRGAMRKLADMERHLQSMLGVAAERVAVEPEPADSPVLKKKEAPVLPNGDDYFASLLPSFPAKDTSTPYVQISAETYTKQSWTTDTESLHALETRVSELEYSMTQLKQEVKECRTRPSLIATKVFRERKLALRKALVAVHRIKMAKKALSFLRAEFQAKQTAVLRAMAAGRYLRLRAQTKTVARTLAINRRLSRSGSSAGFSPKAVQLPRKPSQGNRSFLQWLSGVVKTDVSKHVRSVSDASSVLQNMNVPLKEIAGLYSRVSTPQVSPRPCSSPR